MEDILKVIAKQLDIKVQDLLDWKEDILDFLAKITDANTTPERITILRDWIDFNKKSIKTAIGIDVLILNLILQIEALQDKILENLDSKHTTVSMN